MVRTALQIYLHPPPEFDLLLLGCFLRGFFRCGFARRAGSVTVEIGVRAMQLAEKPERPMP
jgi:hypothetical protein